MGLSRGNMSSTQPWESALAWKRKMAAENGSIYQLQSLERIMTLPTVVTVCEQVGGLYSKIKESNSVLSWLLSTAEACATLAATNAIPYVAVLLTMVDAKVAAELLEEQFPIIKQQPNVIIESTKMVILSTLAPHLSKVRQIHNKTNVLLSTPLGQKGVQSIDVSVHYAFKILDYCIPDIENTEKDQNIDEIVEASADPTLHTLQTVHSLGSAVACRLWANFAQRIQANKDSDDNHKGLRSYLITITAVLRLNNVFYEQNSFQELANTAFIDSSDTESPQSTTVDVTYFSEDSKSESFFRPINNFIL